MPEHGVVLSRYLAHRLGVSEGDSLMVEVLEGTRVRKTVVVAAQIDDLLGLRAYMSSAALAELMREDGSLSGAYLMVDSLIEDDLYQHLKQTPEVAGVSLSNAAALGFRDTVRANMMRMILFNVLFSAVIAVGVVYNAARISLSERSRDLASLRVLGFYRREISLILLGELCWVTLAAIPVGIVCGTGLAWMTLALLRSELYRVPYVIEASTYGWAVVTVVVASLLSGLLVRRRLDRLDLVAVLKTRE